MATKTFKIGLSATDKQNMAQDIYEQVEDLLFEEYDSSETYNTNDYVVYSGVLYRALEDNITGTWDNTKWQTATLNDLVDEVNSAVASVNGKANIIDLENGTLVPEKSSVAKNLEPVSSASGSTQTAPFINQGTATNNNDSQSEVDTGTLGQHLEKQGNSVVVNQLVNTGDTEIATISGHKYLTFINGVYAIITSNGSAISLNDASVDKVIDLTQWFCSNDDIPSDLLANPSHFSWFYNGDLSYNTGELVNANGRYIVNGGQNVWDEEWELGGINQNTGANETSSATIRSKNYIRVIPNRTYYFKSNSTLGIRYYDKDKNYIGYLDANGDSAGKNTTRTMLSNCEYVRFIVVSTTTYANDITISLYYEGEDYSQYIPYETPKVYDTGSEVLRKAGSVKDYKEPNGTIHRLVGVVDLGTLSWTYNSGDSFQCWYTNDLSNLIKGASNSSTSFNGVSTNYIASDQNTFISDTSKNGMFASASSSSTKSLFVRNGSSTAQPTGTLYYELETPTTEQGTAFTENMDINDMGNMAWYSAYTDETTNTLVSVPQGCKIFYPAWYVGFLDTLGQREDIGWSPDKIVSEDDLTEYIKQEDLSANIVNDANLTLLFSKLIVMGKQVSLSIIAKNETGSAIASGTRIFTLPATLARSTTAERGGRYVAWNGTTQIFINQGTDAKFYISGSSIANEDVIYIDITYLI